MKWSRVMFITTTQFVVFRYNGAITCYKLDENTANGRIRTKLAEECRKLCKTTL